LEKKPGNKIRVPVIDLGECTDCGSCMEICPEVFQRNSETGCIEVLDLPDYPEEEILEAIAMCPADCITWDKVS
jgi:ferredoxin